MPQTQKVSQKKAHSAKTPAEFFAAIDLKNRETNIKKLSLYSFLVKEASEGSSASTCSLGYNDQLLSKVDIVPSLEHTSTMYATLPCTVVLAREFVPELSASEISKSFGQDFIPINCQTTEYGGILAEQSSTSQKVLRKRMHSETISLQHDPQSFQGIEELGQEGAIDESLLTRIHV